MFAPLLSTALGICEVNHLPLIVFDKWPKEKVFYTQCGLELSLMEDSLASGVFQEIIIQAK